MNDSENRPNHAPLAPTQLSLLDRLIRFCLENKLVVTLFVAGVVLWGVMVAPFDWEITWLPRYPVPVDAIPDIGENQQIVFTEWMGRSPQDVEDQITYPLTVSLLGVPGVRTVRSYSFFGFSTIYVIFNEDVEFYWSRTRVLEKLNSLPAGTLPEGVQPALGPDSTPLGQIFWYTLEGRDPDGKPVGGWDLHELRTIQDWYVRYYLLAAEGISEVASVGGFVREYQVDADPDAMRAHRVTLDQLFMAVRMSNIDVGARTIEVNRAEYFIRGLGFVKDVSDIENSVVTVNDNVPIYVKDVARVSLGPGLRRGALDKGGAEAVGGVVVVRYGFNPLEAIKNVKKKIKDISPGLPTKAVVDYGKVTRADVAAFAKKHGFKGYASASLNQDEWLKWLRSTPRDQWPNWITTSHVTVVPFYDRTGLIYETLGTLNTALVEEILVTIIVVIVMVMDLRSSMLISGLLPLAVLMCFIAMKLFHVDANIVALSGIAIAIGTMVDMGIVMCENMLKHLEEAGPDDNRLEVIFRASSEVGSAVLTAICTTVISFLPVFTMTGAEGKLFKPLAFTKTFALIASVLVALFIIPPAAHLLFGTRVRSEHVKRLFLGLLVIAGVIVGFWVAWWAGAIMAALGVYQLIVPFLPAGARRLGLWGTNGAAVLLVGVLLTEHWLPLGPERGLLRNFIFVGTTILGLLLFFQVFVLFLYAPILRWCLNHKLLFLSVPIALVAAVLGGVWLGLDTFLGPINRVARSSFASEADVAKLIKNGLLREEEQTDGLTGPDKARRQAGPGVTQRPEHLLWTPAALAMKPDRFRKRLDQMGIQNPQNVIKLWFFPSLKNRKWKNRNKPKYSIASKPLSTKVLWTLAQGWDGLGKEFMPPLDEGSYLYMPTTMPHASIGEALDVLQFQDKRILAIPEVESVVGKIGRVESPLDPAPISMIETVINYRPEYVTDKAGHRMNFKYDEEKGQFIRDEQGNLIEDPAGRPYRQWRDHIKKPDDIWEEIVKAAQIPGTTSAPRLQPIAARIVMLQSGMRAPMGVKVKGPDLDTIEQVGLQIEKFLKEVPSVEPTAVIADRVVGKPYLEIDFDRTKIARYGLMIRDVQDIVEVAIGGRRITTTVEGRERYPVRVRYLRELRDTPEQLGRILVPAKDGSQIPLGQVADIKYVRGPQVVKSEDTFLTSYVLFDMKPGHAEVDVVEECQRYLQEKIDSGELVLPPGVSFTFAGNYENQLRAQKTLSIVLPVALFTIFLILYFQFKAIPTTLLVFSGIIVGWAGGFLLIWLYAQPWFLDFDVFGVSMRELFQVHPINLSVAIWVGFLALFGIASDNGVIIATYLDQSFARRRIETVEDARRATVEAGQRRARPCLMTAATTILALVPVLTSTGRGSDIMVPMAIPSFGGMLTVIMTMFTVPTLYCAIKEFKLRWGVRDELFAEHARG